MDLRPDEEPPEWAGAFAEICDSHRGRLVRWLTSIFGPRDAEDIAQEALARLYVRPGLLEDDADAWPWLSVVARNVGRDMARHNAFSVAVGHEALEQVAGDERVHDAVVARDDARRLAVALRSIGARDRALLLLRDVQGVSVAEIAETLGMNDNAVRQQLFRARKKLANAYLALGGDRTAGFGTLLGLRVREFFRKHGHTFHAFGPASSGVWANALPAIAAIVGGALFTVSAPPVVAAADGRLTAADLRDTPHGVAALRGLDGGGAPGAAVATYPPPPPPTDPPIWEREQEVGPARARAAIYQDPVFDDRGGWTWRVDVHIDDLPVVGDFDMTLGEYAPRDGRGLVCTKLDCPGSSPVCFVRPCPSPSPTPGGSR